MTATESLNFYFNYITSDGAEFADYAWAELKTSTGAHVAWLFTARTQPTGNTSPGAGLPANDSTLVPPTSAIVPGGPVWSKLGNSSSGQCYSAGCGYTGWIQSTYSISTAGSYEVVFGVTNWTDTLFDSGLAFDGLQAGGIPIPTGCGAPGVNIKASGGQTCVASGSYVSTDVIAGQATGAGSLLTNVKGETQNTFSFSTSADNTPAVQADTGGAVKLAATSSSISGTVTTTGNNSIGLYATGSASTDSGSVASSIDAQNVDVTTQGSNASGVQADDGGLVTLNGGSVTTSGAGAFGLSAFGSGSNINVTGVSVTTAGAGAAGVVTANGATTNFGGGSVATSGQDAHALFVIGSGSAANLSGAATFATTGAGATGLFAALGGAVSATGSATITTTGGISPATGLGASGVVADGAGSQINLGAATIMTSGAGAFGLLASDATGSGSAGSITATGTLAINTTNPAAAAIGLQGAGASILATGGGMIASAGNAIEFRNATNAVATFDNFTIDTLAGDLVFADPSTATVNFNSTIANAGTNALLDATAGSVVTLNANTSNLTGSIRTDPTSTSNVNLTGGTMWTITGPSTVTNLSVVNSIVVFAPPGSASGFKTLTVTNYFGSGANVTMNVALGGASSASDQIVVNGGRATGLTLLTIRNVGGLGGRTSGPGIPLVIATNGGAIASNAFALANTPVVGGFRYTLDESDNAWYLVSQPASTVADITNSITSVAKAQQTQMITNRVLSSILLGATEQISCSSCGSGFASIGSFAAGAHGRWSLSDDLTLMGGFSYNQWNASGITVQNAPTIAGSLVYDFRKWGASRPFLEAGGALTPYEDVRYSRSYADGLTTSVGNASAINRNLSLFARAGWVARLSPIDEVAAYGDLSRNWMQTGAYTEAAGAANPFPATVAAGLDLLNVARVGGQVTHLFNGNIEANVSGAVAYGFGAGAGSAVSVYDFGPIAPNALPNTTWVEYGARLGYRYSDRLVIDAFVVGTAFGEVGGTVHGGIGVRYSF